MNLMGMNIITNEDERSRIMEEFCGEEAKEKIDYALFDNSEITYLISKELAEKEMVQFILECIKKEFDIKENSKAFIKWNEYKLKHGINIAECEEHGV